MGWNISNIVIVTKNHVDAVTGTTDSYQRCKNLGGPADFWAGFASGLVPISDSEISTRLYGCGHALIDIGNCYDTFFISESTT